MEELKEKLKEKKYTLCSLEDTEGDDYSEIIYDFRENLKLKGYGGIYTRIGGGYGTLEGCIEGEKIPEQPCKQCGSIYSNHYSHKDLSILGLCFSCDLWTERINKKNAIVVDHVMYSDGGRKSREESGFLGHGGREFKILMNNGREIETNNLWCGGNIPKRFQENIPDNAVFITQN